MPFGKLFKLDVIRRSVAEPYSLQSAAQLLSCILSNFGREGVEKFGGNLEPKWRTDMTILFMNMFNKHLFWNHCYCLFCLGDSYVNNPGMKQDNGYKNKKLRALTGGVDHIVQHRCRWCRTPLHAEARTLPSLHDSYILQIYFRLHSKPNSKSTLFRRL